MSAAPPSFRPILPREEMFAPTSPFNFSSKAPKALVTFCVFFSN